MTSDTAGRRQQIRAMISLAREHDRSYLPILFAASLGTAAVLVAFGFVLGHPILFSVVAFLAGVLVALIITGRRSGRAALAQLEGQPGAAYAMLASMRGDWRVTPAIALTRTQDCVHRVVGRPGVILVAEGAPGRAKEMLAAELRKTRRAIGDTPMYDIVVGDGDGQVPLRRLQMHLMKLPRNLKPRDVNAVDARLKAMGGGGPALPIPKGPLPKGVKMPKGGGKIR